MATETTKSLDKAKDYEFKIDYLKDHLSRMWSRFNYFLGIQTAIAGGKFFFDTKTNDYPIGILGLLFAIIWYMLGAQDRYLCELYRMQVQWASKVLGDDTISSYVGQVKDAPEAKGLGRGLLTWRWEFLSSTKMAAFVPLLMAALWIIFLLLKILGKL